MHNFPIQGQSRSIFGPSMSTLSRVCLCLPCLVSVYVYLVQCLSMSTLSSVRLCLPCLLYVYVYLVQCLSMSTLSSVCLGLPCLVPVFFYLVQCLSVSTLSSVCLCLPSLVSDYVYLVLCLSISTISLLPAASDLPAPGLAQQLPPPSQQLTWNLLLPWQQLSQLPASGLIGTDAQVWISTCLPKSQFSERQVEKACVIRSCCRQITKS